jgi:hypothetical protein
VSKAPQFAEQAVGQGDGGDPIRCNVINISINTKIIIIVGAGQRVSIEDIEDDFLMVLQRNYGMQFRTWL